MTSSDDHRHHLVPTSEQQATLDEIFRAKNPPVIESEEDLACDGLFETDDELDEFLAYTYDQRRADRA